MTKPPDGPPCALHLVHHPSVARNVTISVAGHPVTVCPTGAMNFQVCLEFLTGKVSSITAKIGRETWDLAQVEFDYLSQRPT